MELKRKNNLSFEQLREGMRNRLSSQSLYSKNEFSRLVVGNTIISEKEKIELLSYMWGGYDLTSLLRQGLYNIILMFKNNAEIFPYSEKISSMNALIERGILVRYNLEIVIHDFGFPITVDKSVVELTPLGKKCLDSLVEKGEKVAKKERERLERIGL